MAKDLSKIAKQKKIKYFLISYVDFFGSDSTLKSVILSLCGYIFP